MIALDTNILVYAHRPEYVEHAAAADVVLRLAGGSRRWALPWPCLHEFLAQVSRRSIYREPTSCVVALDFLQQLMLGPAFVGLLGESANHVELLRTLVVRPGLHGGAVHDARIAAICLGHGVSELWTADRDFLKFPELKVSNPLMSIHER